MLCPVLVLTHYACACVGLALAHLNEWACCAWNHRTFLQREALELARKAVALDSTTRGVRCAGNNNDAAPAATSRVTMRRRADEGDEA